MRFKPSAGMTYSWRRAFETNGFVQFDLMGASKLSREARARGINCPAAESSMIKQLEVLDTAGAFRPIAFGTDASSEMESLVFRDEVSFVPWQKYEVSDGVKTKPRPYYSPWQLLYLNDAYELQKASVSVEWLLDDARRPKLSDGFRAFYSAQLERWQGLDDDWLNVIRLIVRLSSRYGPAIKGSLMKSTVRLVWDPDRSDHVDPRELEPAFNAGQVLEELQATPEWVRETHERLAFHGHREDPLERWYMLMRMAPAKARARLRGAARRAQDAYDAAEMVRAFYYDLTGELLLAPDEIYDVSDKSWKRRLFGRWPLHSFTRADLAVELRRHDLHPHQVHIVVEGDTEEIVCRRILEAATGRPLNESGVSMHRLRGVDSAQLQHEMLLALKEFPRYVVLIADREGTIGAEVAALQLAGVIADESTLLWPRSFEEANFTDEELVGLISDAAAAKGAKLTIEAVHLRRAYEEHRERVGKQAQGLATFALKMAAHPDQGSVRVSKVELAEAMAALLLQDLRRRGEEIVGEDRPIVRMLGSVIRVT